jgi:hypothetical protein
MPRHSFPRVSPGAQPVLDVESDVDEKSEIRSRLVADPPLVPHSVDDPVARGKRVAEKIQRAQALLVGLGESDARRRLLRIAILRRDEVLLDGLTADLQRHTPAVPSRRRLSG